MVEQPYRPVNRPPVALLTILDDGSTTTGETVRIREPVCLIGRTEGSVGIPHDQSMSSRHAETTTLNVRGETQPSFHTDRNTLKRIAAAVPNPLAAPPLTK